MSTIEIELSRKKNVLLLLGAIMFVVIGFVFVMKPEEFITSITRSKTLIVMMGLGSIVFFWCVWYLWCY